MSKSTSSSEESDSDGSVTMEPKPIRSQKKPERFGKTGNLTLSDDDSTNDPLLSVLSDDSTDDYIAEKHHPKRKIVHTVSKITKKSKINNSSTKSQITWNENYDEEFDQLNKSVDEQLKIHENSNCENNYNNMNADGNSSMKNSSSCAVETISMANIKDDHQNDKTPALQPSKSDVNFGMNSELLIEILARVRNIEDSLMRTGSLADFKKNTENVNPFNEFHTFSKSNRLPLQNMDDLIKFGKNLNDTEFRKVAVSIK